MSYVSMVQVSTHAVTLAQFSSRLKGWKGKLMSAHYTETTPPCIILHISCPLKASWHTDMYAHTSMWTHFHTHASTLTRTYINIHEHARTPKSGRTHIHIPFNPAHHISLSGQPLMMLKRERETGRQREWVWNGVKYCFSEWSWGHPFLGSEGGMEGSVEGREEEGRKFWMQHVFKERNLHNFWQMIGRRGRGGKGEQGARWKQTWRKWEWESLWFCKHLNISLVEVVSVGH